MVFHRESPGGREAVPAARRPVTGRRASDCGGCCGEARLRSPYRVPLCQWGGIRSLNTLKSAISASELPRLIPALFYPLYR